MHLMFRSKLWLPGSACTYLVLCCYCCVLLNISLHPSPAVGCFSLCVVDCCCPPLPPASWVFCCGMLLTFSLRPPRQLVFSCCVWLIRSLHPPASCSLSLCVVVCCCGGGTCSRVQRSYPQKNPRSLDICGRLACCLRVRVGPSWRGNLASQTVNPCKAVVASSQGEQSTKHQHLDGLDGQGRAQGAGG